MVFLPGNAEKHAIGIDMVPEIDHFYRINEETLPQFEAKFDPLVFQ